MKTKPHLLATAGSTVDGRVIDGDMLDQMASSFDPKTYGARLNIEHLRGVTPDGPFRAMGDVLELSVGEVELDFNGTKEKRKALYGVFDVTEDAKKLNDAGQKVYPSIEIEPNFAGKGFAYMMGCALTDSPASLGTERLQFNRKLPGTILLTAKDSGLDAAAIEFVEEAPAPTDLAASISAGITGALVKLGVMKPAEPEKPKEPETPAGAPDMAAFAQAMGTVMTDALTAQANTHAAQITALTTKLDKLASTIENTEEPGQIKRPPANGPSGGMDYSKIF